MALTRQIGLVSNVQSLPRLAAIPDLALYSIARSAVDGR